MKDSRKKQLILVVIIGIFSVFFINYAFAYNVPDIFTNYQSYNSNVNFGYGSMIENASENNNYRNYLDTSIYANDFYEYDNITSFSNSVDYANYLYQQQVYNLNDGSLNSSNGNYLAIFSFENESGLNPDGFTLYEPVDTSIEVINYLDNHKEVLCINDSSLSNYAIVDYDDLDKEFGTYEFWFYTIDSSKLSYLLAKESSNAAIYFQVDNNYFQYYDGSSHNIIECISSKWYHIKIDFECGNNGYLGLESNTYSISINQINYGTFDMNYACESINLLRFASLSAETSIFYIDSLGFSWNSEYLIGNNMNSEYNQQANYETSELYYENDYKVQQTVGNKLSMIYFNQKFLILENAYPNPIIREYSNIFSYLNEYAIDNFDDNMIYITSVNETSIAIMDVKALTEEEEPDYSTIIRYYDNEYNELYSQNLTIALEYNSMSCFCFYNDSIYFVNPISETRNTYFYQISLFGSLIQKTYVSGVCYEPDSIYTVNDKLIVSGWDASNSYKICFINESLEIQFKSTASEFTTGYSSYFLNDEFYILGYSSYWSVYLYDFSIQYLDKGTTQEIYLYDSTSSLTGKISNLISFMSYDFINSYHFSFKSIIYKYSGGSFTEINRNKMILTGINDINSIEIHVHDLIMYVNNFKKLAVNVSILLDDSLYDSYVILQSYLNDYKFDKMLLHQFNYIQNNTSQYNDDIGLMYQVNTNYYKNDMFGYRTIGCLDLEQKFTRFYEFGLFSEIISVNDLVEPTPPDDSIIPTLPFWQYQVSTIQFDYNFTIYSTHFNFTYPIIVVVVQTENFYYNPETISYLIAFQIEGNFGIFGEWNWIRDIINFVIRVLYLIPNLFILCINFVVLVIYFIAYLVILIIRTLIMTYIVGGILILFWNLLFSVIIWSALQLAELFIGLYVLLIILVDWIFEIVIPGIIIGGTLLLSGLIALFLWLLTGFQGNYLEILNTVNSLMSQITLGFYEIFLIILTHILIVLLYFSAYLLCVEMVLIKYYYTKARGFKGRSERIYESYLSYRLVIEVPISVFNWFKRLIFRWT